MIHLILPYPPSVNKYWLRTRKGMRLSDEARAYKMQVANICQHEDIEPIMKGEIRLTLHVYRPRKTGDLDNTFKAIGDSLEGLVYANDRQIAEIHAWRHDDKLNPRVEIEISAI